MDFGMPTLLERSTLEENAQLCKQLGLQFVEINMNLPQYQAACLQAGEINRLRDAYGIYFTLHLDENFYFSDFNERVSKAHLDTLADAIQLSKACDIPLINLHMWEGVYFTLPDRKEYLFDIYKAHYHARLMQLRDLSDASVLMAIENTGALKPFVAEGIELLLQSPHFCLTYDIGHDYCAGGGHEAFIAAHEGRWRHMHLHDALGKQNHMQLGTGELDLARYINWADACGCRVVVEVKTQKALRSSITWLRAH